MPRAKVAWLRVQQRPAQPELSWRSRRRPACAPVSVTEPIPLSARRGVDRAAEARGRGRRGGPPSNSAAVTLSGAAPQRWREFARRARAGAVLGAAGEEAQRGAAAAPVTAVVRSLTGHYSGFR